MLVEKSKFVRIRKYLLLPNERAKNIPLETSKVPMKMWVKGRLNHEGELFEDVEITTVSGRIEKGTLKEVEPKYKHSYGDYVEELQRMREIILSEMWGEE